MTLTKWISLKRALKRTDSRSNGWWVESPPIGSVARRRTGQEVGGVWLGAEDLDAIVAGIDAARRLTQYLMRGAGAQFSGPDGVALATDADLALHLVVED